MAFWIFFTNSEQQSLPNIHLSDCIRPCHRIYRPVCGSNGITYMNKCTLDIVSFGIFLEYSQNIPRIFLEYSQNVPKIPQEYSQNIPRIFLEYSKNIPRIFQEYSQNIPRIFQEYSKNIPKIFQEYSQTIPRIFLEYSQNIARIYSLPLKIFILDSTTANL